MNPRPGARHRARRFRALRPVLITLFGLALLAGCSGDDGPMVPRATRTYVMGSTGFPPRPDLAAILQTVDTWAPRADVGLILTDPPWDSLLAGRSPDTLVRNNQLGFASYFRGKGLRIYVSVDPTNGLDRASDAPALVALGRSLAEPGIQQLYRAFVTALDTLVRPDYLGVASETNLIRAIAPPALYTAVVDAATGAAADVKARDPSVKLFTTVQVEVAWGRLSPPSGFVGIAQDRADFPFIQTLGLSSYPYLAGFSDPDSLPLDYYARLVQGAPIPVMLIEGGWPSDSAGAIPSTPELQRRYFLRHQQILDRAEAIGWIQLLFTDLDLTAFPDPPGSSLAPFAHLGLVDKDFNPKPALSIWDAVHAFPRR